MANKWNNKFFSFFKNLFTGEELNKKKQMKNYQGSYPNEELNKKIVNEYVDDEPAESVDGENITFKPLFTNKKDKISNYRSMYHYPEIKFATEQFVNSAINEDDENNIASLYFRKQIKQSDEIQKATRKKMLKLWDKMIEDVLDFNTNGKDMFKKFIIEGELFIELIPNKEKDDIIGSKILPAYLTTPVYNEGGGINFIDKFVQFESEEKVGVKFNGRELVEKYKENLITFNAKQIAYANFGDYGLSMYDVYGYYESAIIPYQHLKAINDANTVYKVIRSQSIKIWNIFTNGLKKGNALNYIRKFAKKVKSKLSYNSDTGKISTGNALRSMERNYYFGKDSYGNKTEVSELNSKPDIGSMEDVDKLEKKLFRSLMIPKNRWDPESKSELQAERSKIMQDEVNFQEYIDDKLKRFSNILLSTFKTMCILNDIPEEYINKHYIQVKFFKHTNWKFWFKQEVWAKKISAFGDANRDLLWGDRNEGGLIHPKWFIENVMEITEKDLEINKRLIEEEKEEKDE